jgi:hypothetical protein
MFSSKEKENLSFSVKVSGKQSNRLARMFWWTLFTMETERDGHLHFLDTDIYGRHDSSLGNKVYRKPAHTNLYVNFSSHHHPFNMHAVLSTLELCMSRTAFIQIWCSWGI